MFYNTEILTSRKGGFAPFWLAATVGSKGGTAVKKLSRKELLACDVVRACEKVAAPDEPLALRLSANLALGITRVYHQQYTIYASDVTQVHQALKKALSSALTALPDSAFDIDITTPQRSKLAADKDKAPAPQQQGLNLAINPGLSVYGFDPDADLGTGWHLPGEGPEADEAPGFQIEGSFFTSPSPAAKERKPFAPHQAREEDITLQEPHLQDYLLHDLGREDLGLGQELDPGAFGEGDPGLLEGHLPELDAVLRASSAGGRGGASSSAVGGYFDPGDHFAGQEFGGEAYGGDLGGMGEQVFDLGLMEGEETTEERVRREHAAGEAGRAGVGAVQPSPGWSGLMEMDVDQEGSTPGALRLKRISDALEQVQAGQAAKKPRKSKFVAIDRNTELSDDAFRNMRTSYPDRMAAERKKSEKALRDKEARKRAMDLVFGVPPMCQAPALAEFWKSTVSAQLVPFEGGKAAAEKKKRLNKRSPHAVYPNDSVRAPGGHSSDVPYEGVGVGGEFAPGDFGAGDLSAGQEFGGDGGMGGIGEQFFDGSQHGRAGSAGGLTGSRRQSMLPWAGEPATSDVEGGWPPFGASSHTGTRSLEPLQHHGGKSRSSRTPSLLDSNAGFGGSEGRPLLRASSVPAPSDADAAALLTLEHQFLAYARRQAAPAPASRGAAAGAGQLLFSDIVPVADTNASTAAQALNHLLSLAGKGLVKVRQDEAYGERSPREARKAKDDGDGDETLIEACRGACVAQINVDVDV
ncbi:hypothetical protein JCM1840_005036 [Sporobolomyces johnsonii]